MSTDRIYRSDRYASSNGAQVTAIREKDGFDIIACDIIKRAGHPSALINTDIAVPGLYILPDQRRWRPVCRSPLIGISVLTHKLPGNTIYFHYPLKIFFFRFSDFHPSSPGAFV